MEGCLLQLFVRGQVGWLTSLEIFRFRGPYIKPTNMQIKCCIYLSIVMRKHQDQGSLQNSFYGFAFPEGGEHHGRARTNKWPPPLTAGGRHGSRTRMLRTHTLKGKQEAEKMSRKCFYQWPATSCKAPPPKDYTTPQHLPARDQVFIHLILRGQFSFKPSHMFILLFPVTHIFLYFFFLWLTWIWCL